MHNGQFLFMLKQGYYVVTFSEKVNFGRNVDYNVIFLPSLMGSEKKFEVLWIDTI